MFSNNVGRSDRTVRLALGAGLVYLAVTRWPDSFRGKLALAVGMGLLVTGASRWGPVYAFLGIDTRKDRIVEPLPV